MSCSMVRMKRDCSNRDLIIVLIINLVIAIGFYWEHLDSGYSMLASDVQSIVPIGQKFDDPDLFQEDLFLNDLDNVRYYTPFFVQPMRYVAQLLDGDYLQALNLMGLVANVLYGVLWFLLFYRFTQNFWAALTVSLLIRGVVWLPGLEVWGITELWSIMPRTIFITFMPVPFLLLDNRKHLFWLSAFLIGLVFNFHAITGLGGILIFTVFTVGYAVVYGELNMLRSGVLLPALGLIMLGMLPFLYTYFSKTDIVAVDYDKDIFKDAFHTRIPLFFEDPLLFFKQWSIAKVVFYLTPIVLVILLGLRDSQMMNKAKLMVLTLMMILLVSSISIYVERLANDIFGTNIRMAFQMIRFQKLAIIPSYFAMAYLLLSLKKYRHAIPSISILFIFILLVAKAPFFDKVPIIGDDLVRTILPRNINIVGIEKRKTYLPIDQMMDYISKNTEQEDVFVGPPIIRASAKRSVILDPKGSASLIEGNPRQFVRWYLDRKEVDAMKTLEDKVSVFKKKGANYLVTREEIVQGARLVHQIENIKLYRLE